MKILQVTLLFAVCISAALSSPDAVSSSDSTQSPSSSESPQPGTEQPQNFTPQPVSQQTQNYASQYQQYNAPQAGPQQQQNYNQAPRANISFLALVVREHEQNPGLRDNYPCPGVIISLKHVLVTLDCMQILHQFYTKAYIVTSDLLHNPTNAYRIEIDEVAVLPSAYKYPESTIFYNNLVILTLKTPLPANQVSIAKLPMNDVQLNDLAFIMGWSPACNTNVNYSFYTSTPLSVNYAAYCYGLAADEFCANPSSTDVNFGSPVFSGTTIIGFTKFGCYNSLAVTKTYPYIPLINNELAGPQTSAPIA